jgi:hypothetical protein
MPVHGWFQAEAGQDALRDQVGLTFPLSPDAAVATSLVLSNTAVELQAGVTLQFGALDLMLLAGLERRFGASTFGLVPELHVVIEAPPLPVYLESWVRVGVHSPFDATGTDDCLTRSFLLVNIKRWVSVGPQTEVGWVLGGPLTSLPVGARANFRVNGHLGLGLFAGWETQAAGRTSGLVVTPGPVGRATVDVTW